MGSAVQSSPLTSTLTMRAFLTVFLAVAVCGEADPSTIGQVLTGRTAGGVITGVSYPGVGAVAGFPYAAVHHPVVGYSHPVVYGKREAEAEPEPYTIGQVLTGQTNGGAITHVDYGHGAQGCWVPLHCCAYRCPRCPSRCCRIFPPRGLRKRIRPLRAPRCCPPRCCRIFRISSLSRLWQE